MRHRAALTRGRAVRAGPAPRGASSPGLSLRGPGPWCVGNVGGRPDRRGNLYPTKQRPEQKIDAAVALMMAVGRAMAEDTNEGDLTDFLRNPLIA